MLYDSDRVFRILLDDFQSRYRIWAAPVGKQVFSDTIGTDLARRAGTVMGGYSTRCKERSFNNAEFSGVWAYTPLSKNLVFFGTEPVELAANRGGKIT
jgi:hypothetical protein